MKTSDLDTLLGMPGVEGIRRQLFEDLREAGAIALSKHYLQVLPFRLLASPEATGRVVEALFKTTCWCGPRNSRLEYDSVTSTNEMRPLSAIFCQRSKSPFLINPRDGKNVLFLAGSINQGVYAQIQGTQGCGAKVVGVLTLYAESHEALKRGPFAPENIHSLLTREIVRGYGS